MSSLPTLISFRLIEIAAARLPPKTPFLGAGHTIARYSHTGYHVWSYQKCLGTIGAIVNLAGLLGRCWIEIENAPRFFSFSRSIRTAAACKICTNHHTPLQLIRLIDLFLLHRSGPHLNRCVCENLCRFVDTFSGVALVTDNEAPTWDPWSIEPCSVGLDQREGPSAAAEHEMEQLG